MKSAYLIFIIILFRSVSVFSQPDPCHKSTEGTDFWFGFMENRWYSDTKQTKLPHYVAITVTAREATDFTVTVGPSETLIGTYSVPANNSTQIKLDWNQVEARGTQNKEDKAIHITSVKPVNVYAFNYCENSSDVAVIYPFISLGTTYYTMCYEPNVVGNSLTTGNGRNSEFLIVGTVDGTVIDIKPSKVIDGITKIEANKTYQIKLNKGQMYQAQSENVLNAQGEGDLTGTYIHSTNFPIAVYSGALATTVTKNDQAWDHLYEQMPPIESWGTEYYTVPLKGRLIDIYRILAAEDALVNIQGYGDVPIKAGTFFEFPLTSNQPAKIYSNKKILVAQYSASNSYDRPVGVSQNKWDGDPFMIILSPVQQTVNDVTFVSFDSNIIKKSYVNIVTRTDQITNLLMDENTSYQDSFKTYNNGLYSYAQLTIVKGSTHRLRNIDPKQGLLATVYGFGGVESFGYGVGFNLDSRVNLQSDTIINGRKTIILCEEDSITLKTSGFDKYLWSTSKKDTLDSIRIKAPGTFSVIGSSDLCISADTVDIKVNKAILTLGNDTVICKPNTIRLDAGLGWKDILWTPNNELTQFISPKTSGIYSVKATNRQGCKAVGSIKVIFDDRPKPNLSGLDTLFCGQKSGILNISADKGTYGLESINYSEKMQGLNAAVPTFGTFPFKFTAIDSLGCASDTTFKVGFHKIPKVSFSIDSTKCYHYNLTANYIGDATIDAARFTWVFGGDTIANGIGITSDTIPLGTNQSKRDLSLRVMEQGCSNADTIKNIKVIPTLEVQVIDTLGCQPFDAEFRAINSEKVFYDWDFGDGSLMRLDNHPFHTYQKDGYYNLKLKVTTEKDGCPNSVSMDSIVYVAPIPTVGFDLDPEKCLDQNANKVSYVGTGDQRDTYNWDLSAFDPAEIIGNPGTSQGPFTFNLLNKPKAPIGLQVVSKYGCISPLGRIVVKRKPSFDFSATGNKGCVPLETAFLSLPGDPVDRISYSWNFGDGTTGTGSGTSHLFNQKDQRYNITLAGFSEMTGCSDTIRKDTLVFVYPKPIAGFTLDHSIVYNDKPEVRFDNKSQGATHYLWDFGDGSTSEETNPFNKFKGNGYKKVLLEAINDHQCSDTISQEVLVAFNRIFPPNAFSPDAPNAVDREFKLSQEAIKAEGYHLVIISRWNDIVFETKNEIKGWDGRMKNGEQAPAGGYVWVLDFTDFLGRTHRQTGTVAVVY